MKHKKTKRRYYSKRKLYIKRKTIRRRKGGVNNNEMNFEDRANALFGMTQFIIESIEQMRQEQPDIDEDFFINSIRALEPEADAIDAHFGNHEMEDMLNWRIEQIMEAFGLVVHNNNNNNTIITAPVYRYKNNRNNRNNRNINNSNNESMSVY